VKQMSRATCQYPRNLLFKEHSSANEVKLSNHVPITAARHSGLIDK
jgi:hypothetical protein